MKKITVTPEYEYHVIRVIDDNNSTLETTARTSFTVAYAVAEGWAYEYGKGKRLDVERMPRKPWE